MRRVGWIVTIQAARTAKDRSFDAQPGPLVSRKPKSVIVLFGDVNRRLGSEDKVIVIAIDQALRGQVVSGEWDVATNEAVIAWGCIRIGAVDHQAAVIGDLAGLR